MVLMRLWIFIHCLLPSTDALITSPRGGGGQAPDVHLVAGGDVPHVLHQTSRSRTNTNAFMKHCQRIHEADGWHYNFWDDASIDAFVKQNFASRYERWHEMQPAIRKIDTVRYMWMYHFGGVYIDSDVECLRPATSLVNALPKHSAWVPGFPDPFTLMSAPGKEFWIMMIDRVLDNWRSRSVVESSGPAGLQEAAFVWAQTHGRSSVTPWVLSNQTESHLTSGIMDRGGSAHNVGTWTFYQRETLFPEKLYTNKMQLLGFLPNKLVDPTACKDMMPRDCRNGRPCNLLLEFKKFHGALFAHHCAGSWK